MSKNGNNKIIPYSFMKNLLRACIIILAFTPLIYDKHVFFPYISAKSFFVAFFITLTSLIFFIELLRNKIFRKEIVSRAVSYIRNPLCISIIVFIFLNILSAFFAVDRYVAIWGTLNYGEGIAGLLPLFSFFFFSLLIFERKDWITLFKVSLIVSILVLMKEFLQFAEGVERPGSFTGNPSYLAGYLLFSIFCGFIVFNETKNLFWKYVSVSVSVFSIIGILIAQTRGTIVGLGLGIISIICLGFFLGKDVLIRKVSFKKISAVLLCIIIVFGAVFFLTKDKEIWQRVPGLSRISEINSKDSTTTARIIVWKSGIMSVSPKNESIGRFLFGWGGDNITLALAKYSDPSIYEYAGGVFNRSHNRLIDVYVTTGLLGLISYLCIWFFLFKNIFKVKDFWIKLSLFFFAVSIFLHLMFIFDVSITNFAFFSVLAFVVSITKAEIHKQKNDDQVRKNTEYFVILLFILLTFFLTYFFVKNTIPAYLQMRKYTAIIKNKDPQYILQNINSALVPFTSAQKEIRKNFLGFSSKTELYGKAIYIGEEYLKIRPLDYSFYIDMSNIVNDRNDAESLKNSEKYLHKLLDFSPNNLQFNYLIGVNLFSQNKYDESLTYFEKAFNENEDFMSNRKDKIFVIYPLFIKHFYNLKDKINFIKTAGRLKMNNYVDSSILDQIIQYIEKENKWPKIEFE